MMLEQTSDARVEGQAMAARKLPAKAISARKKLAKQTAQWHDKEQRRLARTAVEPPEPAPRLRVSEEEIRAARRLPMSEKDKAESVGLTYAHYRVRRNAQEEAEDAEAAAAAKRLRR
jgi:hypothetical protein